jgi:hypothetical protein
MSRAHSEHDGPGFLLSRLCKTYRRHIGAPELKPHDPAAMEMLEQHHDVEQVRALLGHSRRHHAGLRGHPPGPAQTRGVVLRGESFTDAWRLKTVFSVLLADDFHA